MCGASGDGKQVRPRKADAQESRQDFIQRPARLNLSSLPTDALRSKSAPRITLCSQLPNSFLLQTRRGSRLVEACRLKGLAANSAAAVRFRGASQANQARKELLCEFRDGDIGTTPTELARRRPSWWRGPPIREKGSRDSVGPRSRLHPNGYSRDAADFSRPTT